MRRSLVSASWVWGVVFGLASSNAAAGQQPAQIRFDLHDGNFMIGYAYAPPAGIARARHGHGTPVLVMIHGASDTHTVFDFTDGFRAAPELVRRPGPLPAGAPPVTCSRP